MKTKVLFLSAVLSLCLACSGCISINSEIPAIATDVYGNVVTKADENGTIANYYNVSTPIVTPDTQQAQTEQTVVQTQPVATQPPAEQQTQPAVQESTTAAQTATTAPATDEENLNLFNTAVNKIKAQNAGYKKSKRIYGENMQLSNALVNVIANALKDSLLPNETVETIVNKGDSSVDIVSPTGQSFVSTLTLTDIQSITSESDGTNQILTVTLADATNPDPVNSAYAKIFDFLTIDDIMNNYAPDMGATVERENVFFDLSGCYAKATIAPDGTLIGYETFVVGTLRLTEGKIKGFTTDLNIVITSATTYSDFQW